MKSFILAAAVAAAEAYTIKLYTGETPALSQAACQADTNNAGNGALINAFNGFCLPFQTFGLSVESCSGGKISATGWASALSANPPSCGGSATKIMTVDVDNAVSGCQGIKGPDGNILSYVRVLDAACDVPAGVVPYAIGNFQNAQCTVSENAPALWWSVAPGNECAPGALLSSYPATTTAVTRGTFDLTGYISTPCTGSSIASFTGMNAETPNCVTGNLLTEPSYAKAVKAATYTPPPNKSGAASTVVSVLAAAIALVAAGRLAM